MNTTPTHPQLVNALWKDGSQILDELEPMDCRLIHGVMGVAGEAGELLDAIKKHVIYRKPIDRENVIEELGDLEFYLEAIRMDLGLTREETLAVNIAKLSKRYGEMKFSNEAAQARADKQ